MEEFKKGGSADFGYAFGTKARFRVALFRSKGTESMVCRLIPSKLLSFEQIGLSPRVVELLDRPRGLLLVTGPTGSGKTTTLATMVNHINETEDVPHHHDRGPDRVLPRAQAARSSRSARWAPTSPYFNEAIRRALREDPDVIMLGEMRDLETIATAITAAETGHLVIGTLHTTGSARTVDRIIDQFPPEQQEQVRVQLSVAIIGVISQVLMPRADGKGVVAAFEVMMMTPAIENHIRKKETFKITSTIQTSRQLGMHLLDDHLWELYTQGVIEQTTLLSNCQTPRAIKEKLGIAAE